MFRSSETSSSSPARCISREVSRTISLSYISSPLFPPVSSSSAAGGLIAAAIASVCYATVILTVFFGVLPDYPHRWPSQPRPWRCSTTVSSSTCFGFFTVASLTSYLSERLRKTGRELEEASDHLADLQAFNQTVIDSIASGLMTTDLRGEDQLPQQIGGQYPGCQQRGCGGAKVFTRSWEKTMTISSTSKRCW